MSGRERSFGDVPTAILLLAAVALALQIVVGRHWAVVAKSDSTQLPTAPPASVARVVALGEPAYWSRVLSAWLQTFDYQSGVSLPWHSLDYRRVIGWLELQQQLDADNSFPMLAAAHLYGGVFDDSKVRQMVEFVARTFERDPTRHWRWMASVVITARHRLKDMRLAERLAHSLDRHTRGTPIPAWARQMHLFIQLELGETEAAAAILAALIEGGEISEPAEIRFLQNRLGNAK